MRKKYKLGLHIINIVILMTQISCANMEKSILLGGSIGAATGSAIGSQHSSTNSGAAIGALAGASLGYLIYKNKQNSKKTTKSTSEKIEFDEIDAPFLKSPKIRKYWQDDRIEGKKFIKGHWVYEIEEQPVWMQQ